MFRLFGAANKPAGAFPHLASLPLFAGLSPRELKIVAALVHERGMLAGEVIFDEGEEGQAIYFIHSGEVVICRQGDAGHPIATLGAGAVFGELALVDGGPRSAQARAAAECTLGVMFRGDFLALMESHAAIAAKISFQLVRHYAAIVRRMTAAGARP